MSFILYLPARLLTAMWETGIQFLDWENTLEKKTAPPYSCLENPMDREAWQNTLSMGLQRVGHNRATNTFTLNHRIFLIQVGKVV